MEMIATREHDEIMPRTSKRRDTGCPVVCALDVFGDRWSLEIIRDLMMEGRETFGQFLKAGEGISPNTLSDRLKNLRRQESQRNHSILTINKDFSTGSPIKGPLLIQFAGSGAVSDHVETNAPETQFPPRDLENPPVNLFFRWRVIQPYPLLPIHLAHQAFARTPYSIYF
jgi:HxlR-like helix-turn-helix protein